MQILLTFFVWCCFKKTHKKIVFTDDLNGASDGTWTHTSCDTRPSNVPVCLFQHTRKLLFTVFIVPVPWLLYYYIKTKVICQAFFEIFLKKIYFHLVFSHMPLFYFKKITMQYHKKCMILHYNRKHYKYIHLARWTSSINCLSNCVSLQPFFLTKTSRYFLLFAPQLFWTRLCL